jgi:hypothetical protein
MPEQLELFDVCAGRHRGNPNSAAAHARLGRHKPTQRQLVLNCLLGHPQGLTREEIAQLCGLRLQSVCGRVAELLHPAPGQAPSAFELGYKIVDGNKQALVFARHS